MGISAILGLQKKKILAKFKEDGITSDETAVTSAEILEKWGIQGPEHVITGALRALVSKGDLIHIIGDRYYLARK